MINIVVSVINVYIDIVGGININITEGCVVRAWVFRTPSYKHSRPQTVIPEREREREREREDGDDGDGDGDDDGVLWRPRGF